MMLKINVKLEVDITISRFLPVHLDTSITLIGCNFKNKVTFAAAISEFTILSY